MATKEQLMKAIHTFIENDMLPKAEGNYKIILNIAKAAMQHKPDLIFEKGQRQFFDFYARRY